MSAQPNVGTVQRTVRSVLFLSSPLSVHTGQLDREGAMDDAQAERIIRVLEEIRDGQRLQLERQSTALALQAEVVAQQRERLAASSKAAGEAKAMGERAERIVAQSGKVVAGARVLVFLALPIAATLLVFVIWWLFARAMA